MKHRNLPRTGIEDDQETVKLLMEFASPLRGKLPTLSEYLNRQMDEKKMSAPDIYHRADLDRQTFNRIIQFGSAVRASKRTLLQVAIGIYASEREANDLLGTCGFTFELSATEDQAFLFCIRNGFYDMYFVYEAMEILSRAQPKEEK